MTSLRTAGPEDIDVLAGTLARAFDPDPVLSWLVRQDVRRPEGLRAFFNVWLSVPSVTGGRPARSRRSTR